MKKYIIHPNSISILSKMNNFDGLDITEKAKKMLLETGTYKAGAIGDIPVYVSSYVPENEIMVINDEMMHI